MLSRAASDLKQIFFYFSTVNSSIIFSFFLLSNSAEIHNQTFPGHLYVKILSVFSSSLHTLPVEQFIFVFVEGFFPLS